MKQTFKMIPCTSCGGEMPELRLTQYGYDFCVTCSENGKGEGMKHGIPVLMGEGDHTWVETVIMSDKQFQIYQDQISTDSKLKAKALADLEDPEVDEDRNLVGPLTIIETEEETE
jgi:hypothetical protein